jgi:hypothetical protein
MRQGLPVAAVPYKLGLRIEDFDLCVWRLISAIFELQSRTLTTGCVRHMPVRLNNARIPDLQLPICVLAARIFDLFITI